nr:MAG TPA: hypothetical protein [Caudoviricetes sp.]
MESNPLWLFSMGGGIEISTNFFLEDRRPLSCEFSQN